MIKFLDLKSINKDYQNDFLKDFEKFLNSGKYILSEKLEDFEESFSNYIGTKFCVGVASGLDALILTLNAWKILGKIKDGDKVAVPSNTYIATILAVIKSGLTPILIEPDINTFNIDENLKNIKDLKTIKVFLPVHLYGRVCNFSSIQNILDEFRILTLEDSAQAHGSEINGKKCGNLGNASAFSFYPSKNLGALGDGGAITTNSAELYEALIALRNYGSNKKYVNKYLGFNSRLDPIQAIFLSKKLKYLDIDNVKRRNFAMQYSKTITNELVTIPKIPKKPFEHVWHLYVVLVENRDKFKKHLYKNGIETSIHYPVQPSQQPFLVNYFKDKYLISEYIHRRCVSLPMGPHLNDEKINEVCDAVNSYKG